MHLKLFFFTLHIYIYIYIYIYIFLCENKSNKHHNNIIDISSFENGLNIFSSTGFYLKSKVIEGNHDGFTVL